MSARITIRRASPDDAGQVLMLVRELAEYERLHDKVVADEALVREALAGDPPAARALLAEIGGELVGFALYFMNFSTFIARQGLYLEDLYVRPAWRGSGAGRRLMAAVAAEAAAAGARRLDWAVLDWNASAIGFYERLGAKPLSDWRVYRLEGTALDRLAAEVSE